MDDFEQFWQHYPRRDAKKDALKAWLQMDSGERFAAVASIPIHVRYWQSAGRTRETIPLPATWLRGERWNDELEMPQAKDPMGEWWKTPTGIMAKARAIGMDARPGEGYHELKARILAKERAA